jgi:hypothetical protein
VFYHEIIYSETEKPDMDLDIPIAMPFDFSAFLPGADPDSGLHELYEMGRS